MALHRLLGWVASCGLPALTGFALFVSGMTLGDYLAERHKARCAAPDAPDSYMVDPHSPAGKSVIDPARPPEPRGKVSA